MNAFRSERGQAGVFLLAFGTILCLGLAAFATVWLPITDAAGGADAPGKPRSYDLLAVQGRTLYIREGCFECHTQGVRNIFSDSALGLRPSEPGDYFNEAPNLIGDVRLGPDLACVADREPQGNWHVRHLRNPQAVREHSSMPSYDYLSTKELQALAAYLLRLTCVED